MRFTPSISRREGCFSTTPFAMVARSTPFLNSENKTGRARWTSGRTSSSPTTLSMSKPIPSCVSSLPRPFSSPSFSSTSVTGLAFSGVSAIVRKESWVAMLLVILAFIRPWLPHSMTDSVNLTLAQLSWNSGIPFLRKSLTVLLFCRRAKATASSHSYSEPTTTFSPSSSIYWRKLSRIPKRDLTIPQISLYWPVASCANLNLRTSRFGPSSKISLT
mmetsp:Transcript_23476/g.45854  ORF Transcript_23476/g.45854 Transcript_23476/m.45854 type:complete len:217 (-) Transcript_23476:61-711(-)